MAIISDVVKYSQLVLGLRRYYRAGTISLEESKRVISDRLSNRESHFLSLIQKGIYKNQKSPYLKLLRMIGCEFDDIQSLVKKDGIEATLYKLLKEGVYLSYEEFKGKKDVIRGSSHFQFAEGDFENPYLPVYYQTQSSGSRSAGTRKTFNIEHLIDMSYYTLPILAVNNALDVPVGVWKPVLPASSGINIVLRHWKAGKPVIRWFTPMNPRKAHISLQHRLALRFILYGSRLWGEELPKPEYVSLDDSIKIAQWIANTKKQFGGCSLICSVSPAVKLCQVAIENGLDIGGTHFIVSGEPLTKAKRQQIETAGVSVTSRYTMSEIGVLGFSCLETHAVDDVHLALDSLALIQRRRKVEHADRYVNAFLFTPILPSAPKIMLNVESDDYGVIENRRCGCLLGQLGLNQHAYNIRSFAKLTGSGMTIVGSDFIRILEEVLPQKYGGGATDYQLLEEEDGRGQTHLSLVISPRVGALDDSDVLATVLNELRRAVPGGKLAAGLWSQAETLQVKRMSPLSVSGKIMTLHLSKKK